MNLSDTVSKFQTNVELVHEFAKGDKDVVVHGDAGSYPSLAKIAADATSAVNTLIIENKEVINQNKVDIDELIEEYREQLDVSQSAIIAANEELAGLFHLASGIVGKTYHFASTKELRIKHDMRTRVFTTTIIGADGSLVWAAADPINEMEFVVNFTDYESGTISVIFHLNT